MQTPKAMDNPKIKAIQALKKKIDVPVFAII